MGCTQVACFPRTQPNLPFFSFLSTAVHAPPFGGVADVGIESGIVR